MKLNLVHKQSQIFFPYCKLSQDFLEDPALFISYLPDKYRSVFEVLVKYSNYYKDIYPTQTYIAKQVGISREYCNKILQYFKHHGLISSFYRFKKSCMYQLSAIFYNKDLRRLLSTIMRSFRWTPWIVLIMSLLRSDEVSAIQFTLTKFNSYFIYKSFSNNSYNLHNNIKVKRQHNLQRQSQLAQAKLNKLNNPSTKIISVFAKASPDMGERKRKSIGAFMSELISPVIRAIASISLSQAGQVKLSAYPDEAIKWADVTIAVRNKSHPIQEPFSYFNSLCMRYCSEHKLAPQWEYMKTAEAALQIPANAELLLSKKIQEPVAIKQTSPAYIASGKTKYSTEDLERERREYSSSDTEAPKQTFEESLHVRDRYIRKQKEWIRTLPAVIPVEQKAQDGPLPLTKTWDDLKTHEDIEHELRKLDEYTKPEYLVDINKLLGKEFVANYLDRLRMNLKNHPAYKTKHGSNLNEDELYQTKLG